MELFLGVGTFYTSWGRVPITLAPILDIKRVENGRGPSLSLGKEGEKELVRGS